MCPVVGSIAPAKCVVDNSRRNERKGRGPQRTRAAMPLMVMNVYQIGLSDVARNVPDRLDETTVERDVPCHDDRAVSLTRPHGGVSYWRGLSARLGPSSNKNQ